MWIYKPKLFGHIMKEIANAKSPAKTATTGKIRIGFHIVVLWHNSTPSVQHAARKNPIIGRRFPNSHCYLHNIKEL
jgi:hypothetical protein